MKTPALIIALALTLAPAVTTHADAPAESAGASGFLQPWATASLQAFLTVGTTLEWEKQTGQTSLGQDIITQATIEVIAATESAVTLRRTVQLAYENATGYDLHDVTWQEELAWNEVAQRLCPHLPDTDAAGVPSRVQLHLEGRVRDADFYVVERADGADRFWLSVDRPGLLLKFERETHSSVRINGEDISLRRVTERLTAVDIDASAVVLAPAK